MICGVGGVIRNSERKIEYSNVKLYLAQHPEGVCIDKCSVNAVKNTFALRFDKEIESFFERNVRRMICGERKDRKSAYFLQRKRRPGPPSDPYRIESAGTSAKRARICGKTLWFGSRLYSVFSEFYFNICTGCPIAGIV